MAKIKLLVDTDIIIDYLKGVKTAKEIFRSRDIDIYIVDYLIAATAWAKNLPLLTRNRRHFEFIKEIKLSPVYE